MAVLGVSGSPKVGGNTDRMTKALLEKSGRETVFINLSTLRFDPCRAVAIFAPQQIYVIEKTRSIRTLSWYWNQML